MRQPPKEKAGYSTHPAKLSGIPTEGAAVKVFDPSEHRRPDLGSIW
ncbi:MAG: hypothetical protein H6918_12465 [Sphingomonadaceae bacterium]|nr:hypothetical protein [Sphingomonadaceae bacterium]